MMKGRPEPWAYEEFPESDNDLRKEILAHHRQQTAHLKTLGEYGGAIGLIIIILIILMMLDWAHI